MFNDYVLGIIRIISRTIWGKAFRVNMKVRTGLFENEIKEYEQDIKNVFT